MGLVCLQIHYKRSKTLEPEPKLELAPLLLPAVFVSFLFFAWMVLVFVGFGVWGSCLFGCSWCPFGSWFFFFKIGGC